MSEPDDPLEIARRAVRQVQEEQQREREESCIEVPRYALEPLACLPSRRRLKKGWVLGALLAIVIGVARIFFLGPPLFPPSEWPAGTTAQCRDRSFSKSDTRSGTCSWHGGVAFWRYETENATP